MKPNRSLTQRLEELPSCSGKMTWLNMKLSHSSCVGAVRGRRGPRRGYYCSVPFPSWTTWARTSGGGGGDVDPQLDMIDLVLFNHVGELYPIEAHLSEQA